MFCTETNDSSFKYNFFNTSGFEKSRIKIGYFFDVRKLFNDGAKEEYIMKLPDGGLDHYTKSEIKSIIRETKIISQLNHPSILKYFGYNARGLDNAPTLIMEYSSNGSLYEFLENSKNKDEKEDKNKE